MDRRKLLTVMGTCLVPAMAGCSSGESGEGNTDESDMSGTGKSDEGGINESNTGLTETTGPIAPHIGLRVSYSRMSENSDIEATFLIETTDAGVDPANIIIRGDSFQEMTWEEAGGQIAAGEEITINGLQAGETIAIHYEDDNLSEEIEAYEVPGGVNSVSF